MNNVYDLLDVAFLIPIRIDSKDRMRNLNAVLKFLTDHFKTNIYVLEADSTRKAFLDDWNVTYKFITDFNNVFYRTYYLNQLTAISNSQIIAIWDCDVIVNPGILEGAIQDIRHDSVDFSLPYDGRCFNVPERDQQYILDNIDDPQMLDSYTRQHKPLNHSFTVGGAVLFRRSTYLTIGKENENFYGWGPEDIERIKRSEILGFRFSQAETPLFHLDHFRGLNSGYYNKEAVFRGKAELIKICSMNKTELQNYILSWQQCL